MGGSRGARINGIGLLMAVFVFGDSITEHVGTFGGEQERRPPRCASISVAEVAGLMLLGRDSYICSCSPDKASMIPFIGCSTYVLGRTVLNFGPRATPGCTPPQHHRHDASAPKYHPPWVPAHSTNREAVYTTHATSGPLTSHDLSLTSIAALSRTSLSPYIHTTNTHTHTHHPPTQKSVTVTVN